MQKVRRGWVRLLLLTLLNLLARNALADATAEQVVILHGIGKQARDMAPLAKVLTSAGYKVLNLDYPSTDAPIETLALDLLRPVQQGLSQTKTTHFVAHSMGGLVALHLATALTDFRIGRMVPTGNAQSGSEWQMRSTSPMVQSALWPAGQQLTTEAACKRSLSKPRLGLLPEPSIDPISSWLIQGRMMARSPLPARHEIWMITCAYGAIRFYLGLRG